MLGTGARARQRASLRETPLDVTSDVLDYFEAKGQIQQSLAEGDAVRDLGYLEGGDYVYPYAVNDQGQIVGTATDVTPSGANPYWRPVVSENGRWVNIAPDYPHWALQAIDINNKGQVVGGNTNGMWEGAGVPLRVGEVPAPGDAGRTHQRGEGDQRGGVDRGLLRDSSQPAAMGRH